MTEAATFEAEVKAVEEFQKVSSLGVMPPTGHHDKVAR